MGLIGGITVDDANHNMQTYSMKPSQLILDRKAEMIQFAHKRQLKSGA